MGLSPLAQREKQNKNKKTNNNKKKLKDDIEEAEVIRETKDK